ncbi:MAG: hypothetical protein AMK72_09555 [Planctomycetes bacterium SM23_25]|nr:MAG: hypothetical protein AMK72_09555 [Planctomycetes bacterium SM23_25]
MMRSACLMGTLAGLLCSSLSGAAELPLGPLSHDGPATPEQISLYLPVTGPLDVSAAASVRYRPSKAGQWAVAHPLHRIRVANTAGRKPPDTFAGVVTGLEPGASYDVEVTVRLGDSSASEKLTATTRALPGKVSPAAKVITAGATAAEVQAALDGAKPGDVVQFANGTYAVDRLQVRRGGSPSKPICIRGESRSGVVLKDTEGTILQVLAVCDVIVENLTFEGSKVDSGTKCRSRGISFWNGGSPQKRVTIRQVTLDGVDMGIVAWGNTEQLLVYDNTLIGNNLWNREFLESNLTWNDDGIRLPGLGNVAFNNTLTGFGDSLAMSAGCKNVGVHFYRNEILMTGDDAYEGDYGVRNVTLYDNRVHNTMTLASFDPIYGGPAFVFRNIAINVGRQPYKLNNRNTGFFIYNNTVVRTEGTGSGKGWGWNQSNNGPLVAWGYRNNILIYRGGGGLMAMESSAQDPIDFTHNAWFPDGRVWWTTSGGSFRSMAAARGKLGATRPVFGRSTKRHEACVICEADPFATDIVLGETYLKRITRPYTPVLAEGSIPRGAGVAIPGITDGFTGKTPDMGAIITGVKRPVWGDRLKKALAAPTAGK